MRPKRHFPYLDGLRGGAALAVLLMHATNPVGLEFVVRHGVLAVDFFFVLSGFVIAYAYDDRLKRRRISFSAFFWLRIIRLYPMLLAGIVAGVLAYGIKLCVTSHWQAVPNAALALAAEILMLPTWLIKEPGYSSPFPFDGPSWSLFFEFAINFLYAAAAKYLSLGLLATIALSGAVVLVMTAIYHDGLDVGPYWRNFPFGAARVVFSFGTGVLIFRLYRPDAFTIGPLSSLLLAAILVATFVSPVPPGWLYDSVCVIIVYPLIVLLGVHSVLGNRTNRICLLAGRLSYPLYIFHYPIVRLFIGVALHKSLHGMPLIAFLGVEIVTAVGASAFLMTMFDEPVRAALSQWFAKRASALPWAAETAATSDQHSLTDR